jgi:hypothetical protein
MRDPVIEVVGGGQSPAEDVSWVPPANAVHPINHFHTLYMRLAEINEGLLREAGRDEELAKSDAFVVLLGACGSLSSTTAHLTHKLEGIRRDFPKVWEAWRAAVNYRPPDEEAGKS